MGASASETASHRRRRLGRFLVIAWFCLVTPAAWAEEPVRSGGLPPGLEARVDTSSRTIRPGQPVLVEFTIRNTTDQPIVLSVPNIPPEPAGQVAELPLVHIFSGLNPSGVTVRSEFDRAWSEPTNYRPPPTVPEVVIGPRTILGAVVDLTAYFPNLKNAGTYRIDWRPYGGALTSNTLTLEIAPLKQAIIVTDQGEMTMQFLYDLAPEHVANFLELAREGFYAQKTFHRIVPGYFMQGGCPNGDGTGIRLDGKKVAAEFNSYPFQRGTVSMALVEGDPNSASCQFVISNTRLPEWDGKYTAFAQLVGEASFRTLDRLMVTQVDEYDRPLKRVMIRSVRIVEAPAGASPINLAPSPTPIPASR